MSYKSVWDYGRDAKVTGVHKMGEYPSKILPFPAHELVLRFSKEGETILDPFCGSGTFAIEAKALNRNSINYDINENSINLLKQRLAYMNTQKTLSSTFTNCPGCELELKEAITKKKTDHVVKTGDARKLELADASVDCIITDIPYASMIKYSDNPNDLSTLTEYPVFLQEVQKSFSELWRVLKKDKYCVIFVADYRIGASRKILPIHADVINIMQKFGFSLFDLFIWRYYRSGGFRPFGKKPFQAMNVHSYILVFHKPDGQALDKPNRDVRYRKKLIEKVANNHNRYFFSVNSTVPLLTL
jgi:DNA modification methylase